MVARFILVGILSLPTFSPGFGVSAERSSLAEAEDLIEADRYHEAEQLLRELLGKGSQECAEVHFLLGFALAKQEQWSASRKELKQAVRLDREHGRALTELAGVEFKLGDRKAAIEYLRRAERLDGDIDYVRTFLATLLYLENRRTEALFYWNQAGAPRIENISYGTSASVDPGLIQRLFPLNEGEILRREQVLDIRWKQSRFRLGRPFNWQIIPSRKDSYDLEIFLAPSSVLSSFELLLLENAVRAPLYREVSLRYPITLRNGRQIEGSFRWDEPRKRSHVSAWLPFIGSSSDGLGLDFDWRDEQWVDRTTGTPFLHESWTFLTRYEYLFEGRKSLEFHGGYENQSLSATEMSDLPQGPHFALFGTKWTQQFVFNAPDTRRLQVRAGLDGVSGSGPESSRAVRGQIGVEFKWLVNRGSASQVRLSVEGGSAGAALPLSQYFILGVGQDEPRPLRAHPTVDQGRKGASPMGRQYLLANLEFHRRLFRWGIVDLKGFAFSDSAMVDAGPFGERDREWFQDFGFGLQLGALGQDRLEVLIGFDSEESKFNLWVGIPLISW